MVSFYENFVRHCNQIGKTPSKVAQEINISKSIVSRWKNGGGVTDATAMKIAEYFGVPVSELTGETDLGDILYEATRDNGLVESPFKEEPISECKKKLIEAIKELPETQAELLLLLVEQQRKARRE